VEEELNNPENIFHIIYYKGQAAGFSKIIFNRPHPLIGSTAITKLERLYLLKEFYNLKLGLTLFEFIISLSKEENQNGIWLFVWTENQRAVSFYKRNGFEIIGNTDFKISETHSNPNHVMYLKY
jgi:ribosomal protein S18 acetylase RimI-like enzyme